MFRKLVALVPFLGLFVGSPDASAVGLDTGGTAAPRPWDAPTVAPRTACGWLMLYAADKPSNPSKTWRYRFTGECTINVAKQGQRAAMRTVDVLIDAEWNPGMKRAFERVVVQHPELGVTFSTSATCTVDPFVTFGAACTDRELGANKFEAFISKADVPFASNRATAAQVAAADKAVGDNANKLWANPTIARVHPIGIVQAGTKQTIRVDVVGGAGLCPMELDYGDGSKEKLIVWAQDPFSHWIEHTFTKPGAMKVTARALPGCSGDGFVYAFVKS